MREAGTEELSGGGIYRELAMSSADELVKPEIVADEHIISVEITVTFECVD